MEEELGEYGMAYEQWHLDRKVPISIIIALFVQTMTFIWVGVTWKAEVDISLVTLKAQVSGNTDLNSKQEPRIIVLEQQLRFIADTLARIDRKLDQLDGNGTRP